MSRNQSPTSNDVDALLNSMKERMADARTRLKASRNHILSALQELHATHVVVSYSGSGDSGQVDHVEVFRNKECIDSKHRISALIASSKWSQEESRWIESMELKSVPLEEALTEFVYDWLQLEHGGWENNDGASGECTIQVAEGTFLLGHTTYYTETDYAESAI